MTEQQYEPKQGDRVRVTIEGKVTWVNGYRNCVRIAGQEYWLTAATSIEKLAPAEPEWVNGDVVRITALCPSNPYATFIRTEGRGWEGVGGNEADQLISNNWRQGTLDILHKADQQDIA